MYSNTKISSYLRNLFKNYSTVPKKRLFMSKIVNFTGLEITQNLKKYTTTYLSYFYVIICDQKRVLINFHFVKSLTNYIFNQGQDLEVHWALH